MEIKLCASFYTRFFGLMGKKNITYGLCFPKCNSIHTFFMKEKIDVIMTNKNHQVIYIRRSVKKNKIILPVSGGYYTYELPAGSTPSLQEFFNPLQL